MKAESRKRWLRVLVIGCFGWVLLRFLFTGCSFDPSGIPLPSDWYDCSAELWHCQRQADQKPDIWYLQIPGSTADLNGSAAAASYPLLANKGNTYPLYHAKDVVVYSISDDELKGSLLIPTGFAEWKNSDPIYWGIGFNNDIDSLYIAYDSRAVVPAWLKNDYTQYRDKNYKPAKITTSLQDPSQKAGSGYPKFLTLDLYRYLKPLSNGSRINLPGNSFDYMNPGQPKQVKDWSEIKVGDPLMYVVLIKPKAEWNCTSGHKIDTAGYSGCIPLGPDANQIAEFEALQKWNQNYPFLSKNNIKCTNLGDCNEHNKLIGGALTIKPHAYVYSSEIEFVAPSTAKVTVSGSSNSLSVKGKLHFEYSNKAHDLTIHSMTLFIDPFSTDQGNFNDIVIYLLETSKASCKGFTVPDMPCNQYELLPSTFFAAENFKLDGKPHLFVSENNALIPITIDHTNRTFTIHGSLASSAKVNGDTLPINVDLNLVGKFVNFAPTPIGDESDTFSQCVEGTNMNPIHLNAAGSYDVYEPLPNYQATYQWIEDYGQLTEKIWGQGKAVTIGKGQLAYGQHDITLMVKDAHGVAADTMLHVEVADTLPPQLSVPPDVYILSLEDPGAVTASIGTAYAKDMCSNEVAVTNDAPSDLLFPSNQITEVTWRAEDLRGNTSTGTQRVYAMVLKPFKPQFEKAAHQMKETLKQGRYELALCDDASECHLNLLPLVDGMQQLVDLSAKAKLPARQKDELMKMINRIGHVQSSLKETQNRVDQANTDNTHRTRLRKSARRSLEFALDEFNKGMASSRFIPMN